jgi:site-specific DNA recombinase
MTPSHAAKNSVRYRYYISSVLIQGQANKAATLNRVPATEIETVIISALRKYLRMHTNNKLEAQRSHSLSDQDLISTHIARVDVKPDHLAVQLFVKPDQQGGKRDQPLSRKGGARDHANPNIMVVPWRKMPSKRPREIILPAGTSSHLDSRPIRAETRARLVMAIAKGRRWLDELMAGTGHEC